MRQGNQDRKIVTFIEGKVHRDTGREHIRRVVSSEITVFEELS